ncbi:hypothetical protein INR77_11570 [Erythrobacter sp. SCSIO 43205]|uniref:hypothetical protein n=1 Tax=Erythrobacter sp. SCSIO 43205 TaxID=2779361 RepID=UPI001CAA05E2|nr:hypothetical protein [Erythrobacter sp. SCSIO 43205]UAB77434.1 hypothetical protein INR77_11570 [Erythrobacter sp. SCSIO 43205]
MTDLANTANLATNTPVSTRAFPRALQAKFLTTLAEWGNVRSAAKAVGVARATAYRMRRACPTFRKLWDAALLHARSVVEEVLADRALNGTQESVFYHGEEVATRTRYDARLLLAHLGRLDRLEKTHSVAVAADGFDFEVAELALLPERETDMDALIAELKEDMEAYYADDMDEEDFECLDSVSSVSNEHGDRRF